MSIGQLEEIGEKRSLRLWSNSSRGQALLEYTLILLVLVAILAGGIWQLNDAFGKWAQSYFGQYLRCLLDSGELPALGSQSGSICNSAFEPFSIANGRPLKQSSSSSRASSGSGSDSEGRSRNPSGRGGGVGESASSGSDSGSGSRRSPSSSSNLSDSSQRPGSRSSSPSSSNENTGKSKYTGSTGTSTPSNLRKEDGEEFGRPRTQEYAYDLYGEEARRREKEARQKVVELTSSDDGNLRKRTLIIPKAERKIADDTSQEEWGLGRLFRFLLIAAIIIALVLLVGGQFLQISKSWE